MMVTESSLRAAVDAAFVDTARGLRRWPDPHPDRQPADDEYSRVTDPAKWRIVGARVDAWIAATVSLGLAVVERDAAVTWRERREPTIASTDVVRPLTAGALALTIARTVIEGVAGAGVLLGVGEPAEELALIPDCGCDACDSGSQNELDHLDTEIARVIVHPFRRLRRAGTTIDVHHDGGWSSASSGPLDRATIETALADPTGWDELSGRSWLATR